MTERTTFRVGDKVRSKTSGMHHEIIATSYLETLCEGSGLYSSSEQIVKIKPLEEKYEGVTWYFAKRFTKVEPLTTEERLERLEKKVGL